MSDFLWPLQRARLPFLSLSPWVCSNSCPLSQWCHPTISFILCHPLLLLPSIFPSFRVFSSELFLCIRWSECWSFSLGISPSNEYSGLISFKIDWFDLLAVRGTPSPRDSPTPQFKIICHMTQQSHCWAYTPRKPELKETHVPQCSTVYNSQDMKTT